MTESSTVRSWCDETREVLRVKPPEDSDWKSDISSSVLMGGTKTVERDPLDMTLELERELW